MPKFMNKLINSLLKILIIHIFHVKKFPTSLDSCIQFIPFCLLPIALNNFNCLIVEHDDPIYYFESLQTFNEIFYHEKTVFFFP